MSMEPVVSAAGDLLGEGRGFVLATIIKCEGSAPRPVGTRMLIAEDGQIVGTIGGGLLEAESIQAAIRLGTEPTAGRFLNFDLTNQDAATMGMICGGRVQVLLESVRPNDENRAIFAGWYEALSKGRKATLVSVVSISGNKTDAADIHHALIEASPRPANASLREKPFAHAVPSKYCVEGNLHLSDAACKSLTRHVKDARHIQILDLDDCLIVVDPGRIVPTLYIFGAGHVAQPTAHIAAMVGFDVVVLDDRPEFADAARFPHATAVHTLSGFDTPFDNWAVTPDTYIVIITRGHLHDREVLAQALKTPAAYVGMIGSRRKRDAIYDSLLKDGYTAADIERVHSPIGLPIGGDSPEEIAVSIVAELVAVRSGISLS